MSFADLKLIAPLTKALIAQGYSTPTPVQQQAIPVILAGEDVFVGAQTGSGKTAAFVLPILQQLEADKQIHQKRQVKVLVLAPTRELALQIDQSFKSYGAYLHFFSVAVYGGVEQDNQTKAIKKGVDIIVATPGRLLDLMRQGLIDRTALEYFVLDEVDRLLELGFIHDIKSILLALPLERQNLCFSATSTPEVLSLARSFLHEEVVLTVNPVASTVATIRQSVYFIRLENKSLLLQWLITNHAMEQVLIFTKSKADAVALTADLLAAGHKVASFHGDKAQAGREKALANFKNKRVPILVATDIASRGLDIDDLPWVINYDIPKQAEVYVHRIGRTGRAGKGGEAIALATSQEIPLIKDIQQFTKAEMTIIRSHPYA